MLIGQKPGDIMHYPHSRFEKVLIFPLSLAKLALCETFIFMKTHQCIIFMQTV